MENADTLACVRARSGMRHAISFPGPGLWQLGLGVNKQIPLTERFRLQFRAEAFNIFNRTQLSQPNSNVSAGPGEFGLITQPANTTPIGTGTPREMQFALRVEF